MAEHKPKCIGGVGLFCSYYSCAKRKDCALFYKQGTFKPHVELDVQPGGENRMVCHDYQPLPGTTFDNDLPAHLWAR